ncbi:protein kinase [Lentinula raphanica]|uniref:Protein kinase n=1 Tax=Lentinula raphanica TaxID=153919 RepID=A0AA38UJ59_9AGAR|nr:protein kinase [Lentinula raphanica]KAJ3840362.1 protein kinase [Lentinula raphanica]
MEPSPANNPSAHDRELPKTPTKNQQTYGPPIVKSTPLSQTYAAHAEVEVSQRASILNNFLEDDVNDKVVLSLDEFATLILDLPADWKVKNDFNLPPESQAVKDAFEAYLAVAEKMPKGKGKQRKQTGVDEKPLYQPLANLLNALRGTQLKDHAIDEKVFYVQDPRPVLGSLLERKPDLGGIYRQLLQLADNRNLSTYLQKTRVTGVFWGLLLYFVEVKDHNGNFVGLNARRKASWAHSNKLPFESVDRQPASDAPAPPASTSTSMSASREQSIQVTIHQSGGKDKILQVEDALYEQKNRNQMEEEEKLTSTEGQHQTRIQCASYAKEMLSNGFIRHHAIGMTADSCAFRFQYYDRSKVVESQAFHILDEEWKTLFMAMVCQLNKLSSEQLGFIPNLHSDKFDHLRDPKQLARICKNNKDDLDGLVGASYRFECSDGLTRTFVIKRILYRAEGIVGRGSIVAEVECICAHSECKWHGQRKVIKISFPSRNRPSEDELLREAEFKANSTGNRWALNHLPTIVDSITVYYDETTVQCRLKEHLKENYEERVMRVDVLDKLQPLSELDNPRELAQVFYDILQIHQWLYECPRILHRDISMGNIMFRRMDGKVYGVLNDFDLSSRLQDMDKGPTSKHRTGTRPFMSHELLNPGWQGGHYYRHDIESLFYVVLCMACRYERPGVAAAEPRAYSEWFSGSDKDVCKDKTLFFTGDFPPTITTQPHFAGFQWWLDSIYQLCSSGYIDARQIRMRSRVKGSTDGSSSFDWTTLNKRVSYAEMRLVMSSFEDEPLETRWAGWDRDH